jgi:hypothetical protein
MNIIQNIIFGWMLAVACILPVSALSLSLHQKTASGKFSASGTAVHRYAENFNAGSNRISEQIDLTVTSGSVNSLNQLTGLTGGGPVRIAGTINQPSTVTVKLRSKIESDCINVSDEETHGIHEILHTRT